MKILFNGLIAAIGILVLVAGCSDDDNNSPGSLRVRVVDDNSARVPNVTVVLGDSDGVMITYGTTDSNGEYTFSSPPANATVTTARSCGNAAGTLSNEVNIIYDVNGSALTAQHDCNESGSTALGSITVNVANTFSTVTHNKVYIGNSEEWYPDLVTQQTFTVYQDQLQSDGKLSLVVWGYDANDAPIGYGTLLDQIFTSGMTANITVDQPFSFIQYQLTNIPPATTALSYYTYTLRKDQWLFLGAGRFISSVPTMTTQNVPYMPGFGEIAYYSAIASLDQNANGHVDSSIGSGIWVGSGAAPSNQSFDFSQMTILSNLVVSYGTGTVTPTLSWTGMNANSSYVTGGGMASLNTGATTKLSFSFIASPTRTSVVFPQLPDSLAAFRPPEVQYVHVTSYVMSLFTGYDDYLNKIEQYVDGAWSYPSSGYTYGYSLVEYSSLITMAPTTNKSAGSASRRAMKRFGTL